MNKAKKKKQVAAEPLQEPPETMLPFQVAVPQVETFDNSSNLVSKSDLLESNRQDVVELPLVPFLVSSSRCTRPSGLAPSRKPI